MVSRKLEIMRNLEAREWFLFTFLRLEIDLYANISPSEAAAYKYFARGAILR
jgi:hypothetical protein